MFLLIKLLNPSNLSTVMFYRSRDIHFIGLFCFSYFISTYILKCYSRQLSLTLGCFVVVNICCLLLIHASQWQSPITLKWLNLKLNNFDLNKKNKKQKKLILKFCHTLSWPLPWYLHSVYKWTVVSRSQSCSLFPLSNELYTMLNKYMQVQTLVNWVKWIH